MRIPSLTIALWAIGILAVAPAAAQVCPGDCNSDRLVTADEIVTGINWALGSPPGQNCFAFDDDYDRRVDVHNILTAVTRLLNGCGLESLADLERRRQDNLARWRAAGIVDYEIDYGRYCFCLPPSDARVVVHDGAIVAVHDPRSGEEIENPFPGNAFAFNSVDGVFDVIAEAITVPATTLLVDYHPELGYPTQVAIDYYAGVADDEISIRITALRPSQDGD
jgi:hypothetical protein